MATATSAVRPLRRSMIDDVTLRNLSPIAQRSYLQAVAKFSRFFDRSPDQFGLEGVRGFQVLQVSLGISWPTLNQTVYAVRFFYVVTLNQAEETSKSKPKPSCSANQTTVATPLSCILLDLHGLSRRVVDDPQDVCNLHNLRLLPGQPRSYSTPSSMPVWAPG